MATKSSRAAKVLADKRLQKWHNERNLRRQVQDEVVDLEQQSKKSEETIARFISMIDSSQANRLEMKKEWKNATAARQRGGSRSWPVWVVQLICELLVNGAAPTAVRENIQTIYETLYSKSAEELPSVSFVRSCRVTVEIIGETVAAIKLADADTWNQLWTDATTRRQIPFTAVIIGLMGDNDEIDPVVVSSCIFMEDETSATGANGILNKVSYFVFIWYAIRCLMHISHDFLCLD